MRRLAVLLVAVVVLTGCSEPSHQAETGANKHGQLTAVADRRTAGPLQGTLITGGDVVLASEQGQVVVLNFFASWCPPCQTETPQFDSVYRQREGHGVDFLGLGVKDSRSNLSSWLVAKKITFPVIFDEPGKTAIEIGDVPLTGLPDTVLIDKHGRVAALYVGPILPADLNPVLDQLLAET